jgi:hypothetical protein
MVRCTLLDEGDVVQCDRESTFEAKAAIASVMEAVGNITAWACSVRGAIPRYLKAWQDLLARGHDAVHVHCTIVSPSWLLYPAYTRSYPSTERSAKSQGLNIVGRSGSRFLDVISIPTI